MENDGPDDEIHLTEMPEVTELSDFLRDHATNFSFGDASGSRIDAKRRTLWTNHLSWTGSRL